MRKEFRALLPWWAASAGALLLSWMLRTSALAPFIDDADYLSIGIWAYAAGSVVLGAMVVGHEYSHNTLSMHLLQPLDRSRLLSAKAIVLAVLLVGLFAIARFSLRVDPSDALLPPFISWAPLAFGFCLTPWLTMISRSQLGGAVYTALFPLMLLVIGGYLGLPSSAVAPGMVVIAGVGLLLTVHGFARLEVPGTAQSEVDLLGWIDKARPRDVPTRRHPVWMLVTKEIRLQHVTLAAGVVYVIAWVVVGASAPWMRESFVPEVRYAATIVFAALVSLLSGALVSAEERRFGTADWHTLLPTRPGLQWGVKAGVALTLALGLAVGLPALLDALSPGTRIEEALSPFLAPALCLSAMYVSSLNTNGLHALLATVPAIALAVATWLLMLLVTLWLLTPFLGTLGDWLQPLVNVSREQPRLWRELRMWVPLGSVCVLLFFWAGSNHTTTVRPRAHLVKQAAWIVATAWGSALVIFAVDAVRGMRLP